MVTTIIVLICILTVLLILVVLIQNSKGGGLSGELGGLGSNQLMGVKKTTDVVEQITWGLGIGVMVLVLSTYALVDKTGAGLINSANVERAATRALPGSATAPAQNRPAPAQAPAPGAAAPGNSASALRP
ncbi:preprotein translocase subunit SecG [Fibrivirga algicola]|uniref:Protein-export membrane protein SecG n=1 Tax=Fibrivirga algicola TaxID=2950420 RepID=A0ABX0QLR5_9BACT|nr:preprotein translocase subunit SecG [Fibrivirga algicola]NID13077.1 preprotein translocase subunit SecG [Fibrivirga algicola]